MPWNWGAKSGQSVMVGGRGGTVAEAGETTTWPNYDAAYLAKRLGAANAQAAYANRYKSNDLGFGDDTARQVYLEKVASNFHEEADECLKQEFMDWLQGTHEDNGAPSAYPNRNGQMKRRAIFPSQDGLEVKSPGEVLTNWKPTWWGQNQMTHLDGVRDFLRDKKSNQEEHEFALNLLAEFGPQNINQAWTYFKHWVKGRHVGPEECIHKSLLLDNNVRRPGPVMMEQSRSELLAKADRPFAEIRQEVSRAQEDAREAQRIRDYQFEAAREAMMEASAAGTAAGPPPDDDDLMGQANYRISNLLQTQRELQAQAKAAQGAALASMNQLVDDELELTTADEVMRQAINDLPEAQDEDDFKTSLKNKKDQIDVARKARQGKDDATRKAKRDAIFEKLRFGNVGDVDISNANTAAGGTWGLEVDWSTPGAAQIASVVESARNQRKSATATALGKRKSEGRAAMMGDRDGVNVKRTYAQSGSLAGQISAIEEATSAPLPDDDDDNPFT